MDEKLKLLMDRKVLDAILELREVLEIDSSDETVIKMCDMTANPRHVALTMAQRAIERNLPILIQALLDKQGVKVLSDDEFERDMKGLCLMATQVDLFMKFKKEMRRWCYHIVYREPNKSKKRLM